MMNSRIYSVLVCVVLSCLVDTCAAFIHTAKMIHTLPYSYSDTSRGTFQHEFHTSTSKPTDTAFVFISDADFLTFDFTWTASRSIFATYEERFNASYFFIPLRFDQASTEAPPFGLRDTVHMEHMVNDLHVLLTENNIIKQIPKIILVGTGRGGAVAAHYRALFGHLNPNVRGAFVDTPHMKKATTSLIYAFPTGVPDDCTSAITLAVRDIDSGLRNDTTGQFGDYVKKNFNLCAPPPVNMSARERAFFWYQMSYPLARFMNSPHSMTPAVLRSVDTICEYMTMKNYLTDFANVHKAMRSYPGNCIDVDINSALTTGPALEMFQGTELSYSCSGGLAIPTTDGVTSIYAPDVITKTLYDDLCRLYLGPKFNIATATAAADRIERNLNMNKPYAGSKVFFVHSTVDALAHLADIYPVPQPANIVVQSKTLRGHAFRRPAASDSAELRDIKLKIATFVDELFAD